MDGSSKHVNSCNSGVNAIVGPHYFTEQNGLEQTGTPQLCHRMERTDRALEKCIAAM